MNRSLSLLIASFAIVGVVSHSHSHHEHSYHTHHVASEDSVSRVNKNIVKSVEVTSPGAATPKVLFNKVKNSTDEPKYTDYLTALGAR